MTKKTHGGARKGAGRPPAENKAASLVSFRLTEAEFRERSKRARAAGFRTVHAWAKALVLGA